MLSSHNNVYVNFAIDNNDVYHKSFINMINNYNKQQLQTWINNII